MTFRHVVADDFASRFRYCRPATAGLVPAMTFATGDFMDLRRHCLLALLCALLPTASATAQPAPPAERVIRMSGAVPEAAGR